VVLQNSPVHTFFGAWQWRLFSSRRHQPRGAAGALAVSSNRPAATGCGRVFRPGRSRRSCRSRTLHVSRSVRHPGFRLTNSGDCGGQDCVSAGGLLLLAQHQQFGRQDTMLIFLGLERRKGGAGPTLFSVNRTRARRVISARSSRRTAASAGRAVKAGTSARRAHDGCYVPMGARRACSATT